MVFDEDSMLLGLFSRYCDELEELKTQIVRYVGADARKEENELKEVKISLSLVVVASGQRYGR